MHATGGSRPQADRGGNRLVLDELERGQPAAAAQAVAPGAAAQRLDGVVELAELLHVAVGATLTDFTSPRTPY